PGRQVSTPDRGAVCLSHALSFASSPLWWPVLFRERYEHDLRLIRGTQAWVMAGLAGAFLLVLPFLCTGSRVSNAPLVLVYAPVARSLSVLVGLTGQVSLGHAGFLAAGAYAQGALVDAGLPFLLALPLTILTVAALGIVIGLPAL